MPSNSKELDKILDCIVSQEASLEGGWAEYTTDPEAIKYGNPLHNKDELKQAIEALIQKEVVEARKKQIQSYLDQINKYKPDPNAISFGSASGSIETAGWKVTFESDIEALNQANKENK